MARTPSMTVADCEAQLGARPIIVNDGNRRIARKWLTAHGFPALFAGGLSQKELALAYNDESGKELDKLRRKLSETETEAPSDGAIEHGLRDSAVVHRDASGAPDVNRVAALLSDLLSRPSGIDPQHVNDIIDKRWSALPDLIAKYSTVTRLELVKPDGTTHNVEGHVHEKLATLIRAMESRMANGKHPNILIVGPTGSGKTHGVEQASKARGREFYSNGAISMDHQLIGFVDAGGRYHETALREAFAKPADYLFDEIDASDNSPLLCLAGALANNGFRFPDMFVDRHPDSCIIAAANTWGLSATADFVGRNKLDGAIRSRFPVRIYWDYDEKLERATCGNIDWACRVQKARAGARRAGLKVIIDPRMSQAGAALIAAGASFDEAANLTYLADLSPEQRTMVEA